jgi:hypothetical protein
MSALLGRMAAHVISQTRKKEHRNRTRGQAMDYERFNKIAGGIQSIVLSIAALVGGGWALYQFNTLQQAEKAQLDIEELRSKEPVVNIDLSASAVNVPATRGFGTAWPKGTYLQMVATIRNDGKADTYLDFTNKPLKLEHVLDPIGTIMADEVEVDNLMGGPTLCRAGSIEKLTFLAKIQAPGLYRISLEVPVETSEMKRHSHDPYVLEYTKEMRQAYDNLPSQARAGLTPPQTDGLSEIWSQDMYYVVATVQ